MSSFGAFGKIPVLGDFFRTGLGNGFVAEWDRWLQDRMSEASNVLGPRWERCYMSAPIWRFSLAQGLAGAEAVTGVLMPSVDRVGRKFPLTLAATHVMPDDAMVTHFANEPVFQLLESLALDALDDGMTLEHLKDRLAEVRPQEPPVVSKHANGLSSIHGDGALDTALAAVTAAVPEGSSIWTAHIDGEARLAICSGLPETDRVIELLDAEAAIWRGEAE